MNYFAQNFNYNVSWDFSKNHSTLPKYIFKAPDISKSWIKYTKNVFRISSITLIIKSEHPRAFQARKPRMNKGVPRAVVVIIF